MIKIGPVKLPNFPLLLAPMEDVSDPPFRALCKENGADLMYTEFISVEGLIRNASKSIQKLDIYEKERPIGIQIFGSNLESMLKAVDIVAQSKPDIIDINYGCPVKKVVNKNAGAGILRDIPLMVSLTKEIVKRVDIPVTVKTRLGWDNQSIQIVDVAERLQDVGIKAISIHGRTRVQMYKGKADWKPIAQVKNNQRMYIPVFGNGDVDSPESAYYMKQKFGLDGIMIGRAAIGNPWIFCQIKDYFKNKKYDSNISLHDRISMSKRHLEMAINWKGEKLGVYETRRHYNNYFRGIQNFKPLKTKLLTSENLTELYKVFDEIKMHYN